MTHEPLNDRQRAVLRRIALGESNEEIGRHMVYATSSINSIVMTLLDRLGARNRAEAVYLGILYGEITVPIEEAPDEPGA